MNRGVDFAVIGAGISGLKFARELANSGASVVVLEKSRGVGGRAATRRWNGVRVDHGAQFFTARTAEFQTQVAEWLDEGVCFEWSRGFHQFKNGELMVPDPDEAHPRYACHEGFSALGKSLMKNVSVCTEEKVVSIKAVENEWRIDSESGTEWRARSLVLSAPQPQTVALLNPLSDLLERTFWSRLHEGRVCPCHAVMLEYPGSICVPDWKGIQTDDAVVSWMGLDSSRRKSSDRLLVMLHGTTAFTERHLEGDLEAAAEIMTESAAKIAGAWIRQHEARAIHRWRYAKADPGVEAVDFLYSEVPAPVWVIGDLFCGGKIEGAWLSGGRCAAEALS